MIKKLTEKAQMIMKLAERIACDVGGGVADTEHILLAILSEGSSMAAKILSDLGLTQEDINEYMQDGDVVVNSTGTGTLGRVGFYQTADNRLELPIVPDSHVTVVRGSSNIQAFYLYAYLKANQSKIEKEGEGSTNQKELKPLTLKEMLVPMPPVSEQKRIETAITKAFVLIAMIEKSLS